MSKKYGPYRTCGKLTAERIVELRKAGLGVEKIATLNETTPGAVFAMLRRRKVVFSRYGGPVRQFKRGERIKGRLSPEEIVKLYVNEITPIGHIAKVDGTTFPAVRHCLLKKGVKLRPMRPRILHGLYRQAKQFGIAYATYFRLLAIKRLGGRCVRCGNTDFRVLQLNHIGSKQNTNTYATITAIWRGEIKDRDVRCANCNLIYEFERGKRSFSPELLAEIAK